MTGGAGQDDWSSATPSPAADATAPADSEQERASRKAGALSSSHVAPARPPGRIGSDFVGTSQSLRAPSQGAGPPRRRVGSGADELQQLSLLDGPDGCALTDTCWEACSLCLPLPGDPLVCTLQNGPNAPQHGILHRARGGDDDQPSAVRTRCKLLRRQLADGSQLFEGGESMCMLTEGQIDLGEGVGEGGGRGRGPDLHHRMALAPAPPRSTTRRPAHAFSPPRSSYSSAMSPGRCSL